LAFKKPNIFLELLKIDLGLGLKKDGKLENMTLHLLACFVMIFQNLFLVLFFFKSSS